MIVFHKPEIFPKLAAGVEQKEMTEKEIAVQRLFKVLSHYRHLPDELIGYLNEVTRFVDYHERTVLCPKHSVAREALFVFEGYLALFDYDEKGEQSLVSLSGKDGIGLCRSFVHQSASSFEIAALAGSRFLQIAYRDVLNAFLNFSGTKELAMLVLSYRLDRELKAKRLLQRSAEVVVQEFYETFPELILSQRPLVDKEIGSLLMMSQSTLRNTRKKLLATGILGFEYLKAD